MRLALIVLALLGSVACSGNGLAPTATAEPSAQVISTAPELKDWSTFGEPDTVVWGTFGEDDNIVWGTIAKQ